MILQSVPTDDYDEEENGLVSNSPRPPATRKLPLKARRVTAADHRISEEDEVSWKLVALGICCFLGVVAVGASLAVLSRVGQDAEGTLQGTLGNGAKGVKPVLAIFGFRILGEESAEQALPTNNAVAWVAASLLKDHGHLLLQPYDEGQAAFAVPQGSEGPNGPRIPDGQLVQSWRPALPGSRLLRAKRARPSVLRHLVAHGPRMHSATAHHGIPQHISSYRLEIGYAICSFNFRLVWHRRRCGGAHLGDSPGLTGCDR
ncbi:QCT [Symbiodinium natans]|uniref:QCT protein n=1 Tax=Symbiodinium natans TaxID=878477 RepID=A0A812T5T6_9DINO|nr:QCT [Symbiodinium natans]